MPVKSSQNQTKSIHSPASGEDHDLKNDFGLILLHLKTQQIKVLQ